ncbi:PepSY-associated TM helix domain-containing protein [Rhodopseudomonas sp. P2A-2r]|uniref:PepSY-associated TM helix domain-containing protein n=1 Tax=unclassified Rhodopseudomonas TaxID=2638247 RepID=UPI0022344D08|nr:PepSY-associated TM helix domain-containing protein [Rhodopseudomonas sp. P2A-2r]UZE49414.1 PepSY domain-containing protein [Rhodopseudomonas sp. P2A-2r]
MSHRPVKAALLQVHSVIGLAVALVLSVIGLTGATMSFEDEIGAFMNADIMKVEARGAPMLTPDALVARLQATQDLGKVSAVTLSSDPSVAARIRFARGGDGARPSSVYVDPADGRLLGAPRGEDFFATVRKLHRWLLLPGDGKGVGRTITGVVAISLFVMLVSGLVLRWPRRVRSIKTWLKPNFAMRGRGFQWSLHSVVGTWVLPIYLVIALTGLWWSFDWYKDGATWLLGRPATATKMQPKAPPRPANAEAPVPSFDRVWSTFLREQGDRYATAQLTLPPQGTAVRVRSWARGSWHEGSRDEFRIDAASGRVLSAELYADKPPGERVLASVLDIHSGAILGWPGRLLFMLAAALMPLFMVTGFLLYLSRRKLRQGAAPVRGALVAGE